MKKNSACAVTAVNAATAILLFGASIVTPAFAQSNTTSPANVTATPAVDAGKPTPGAALRYVGGDTRIGIGWDSELDGRADFYQVLQSSDTSATLGELWVARHAGGVKLSHQWANGGKTAVNKVFVAGDQDVGSVRKITLGGGQEYQNWFWSGSVSKGISGEKLRATTTANSIATISGTDAGRLFEQDVTTSVASRVFERPYDWGVGARAGHFYESALLRLTAGLDYEWGKKRSNLACGSVALSGSSLPCYGGADRASPRQATIRAAC
jgi:hypothetical protein